MNRLDAAIRARLGEVRAYMNGHYDLPYAEEMLAAIEAVLDRHKPGYPDGPEYEEHDEPVFDRAGIPQGHVRVKGEQIPGYYCETCREFSPCETVRDVAAALGIEAPDA